MKDHLGRPLVAVTGIGLVLAALTFWKEFAGK